jgi:hypothetical protein
MFGHLSLSGRLAEPGLLSRDEGAIFLLRTDKRVV